MRGMFARRVTASRRSFLRRLARRGDLRAPSGLVAVLGSLAAILAAQTAAAAEAVPDGKALFLQNCSACHQESGQGIPGAFPALAGDKIVLGPARGMTNVVLKGRGGMPSFARELSDADLAAVMSYVRGAWGNAAAPVTAAEVAAARSPGAPEPTRGPVQAH